MFFDGTPNQAVCTRLSRENRLAALQRVRAEVTSTLRTLRRRYEVFSSGDGMSASLQQKRKYFCKASQPCIHPPTVFRSGLERNPCNVAWLAKTWRFPMNSSFVEKEPVVAFVWYILTSNQHWDRFLVIIGKTQNVKVSRYLYHTSHRLNFSLF